MMTYQDIIIVPFNVQLINVVLLCCHGPGKRDCFPFPSVSVVFPFPLVFCLLLVCVCLPGGPHLLLITTGSLNQPQLPPVAHQPAVDKSQLLSPTHRQIVLSTCVVTLLFLANFSEPEKSDFLYSLTKD